MTIQINCCIILSFAREWRNRQTRTFEGRVFPTYGFKSRLPHHKRQRSAFRTPLSFIVRARGLRTHCKFRPREIYKHSYANKMPRLAQSPAQLWVRKPVSCNKKGTFVYQKFLFCYPSRRLGMESVRSAHCMASRLVRVWNQPSGCIPRSPAA